MRLFRALFAWMLVASLVPLAGMLALVLLQPQGASAGSLLRAGTITAALSLCVSAILAARVAARIADPVRGCVAGALEIARGRFGHEVPVAVKNEIGDLAYTFNHMSRELAGYDAENRRLIAELEAGWVATITSLASAIDAKDPYTRGHSQRVSELAVEIGRELGLSGRELDALSWGGLLHDIGKIGVPEAILGKAAKLTDAEREVMRAHPEIGAEIVRGAEFLREGAKAVLHHHERWDGGGYPLRLAGEQIPLAARIVGAADTFDAITSDRPYQPAKTTGAALDILGRLRGTQLDPRVHDALVAVLRRRAGAAPEAAEAA
jgi:putative nucleotidyltransferase with HDIG domain